MIGSSVGKGEHTVTTITQNTALWYASRATGVVSLLLLSLVVVLGIVVNRQGRLPGLPSFAITGLHRSLSLLSVIFIAVHVITAIVDPFVSIRAVAVFIPFTSSYQPFWLGLGAVALDLILALVVTGLARAHMSRRLWRAIHWLAYVSWPVALVHGIGVSPDLRGGGLKVLAIGCGLAVGGAVIWRLAGTMREIPRTERAAHILARTEQDGGHFARRSQRQTHHEDGRSR
jgi:predicted ferric reductase